ncbi:F-box protein At2g43440-like isoform X2 [Daucus carota subsp. sativus]|uniref:F-box protein At2g43440-like isoform X2 n=1 Tax=Daucus carota subsp. sativus TaxID=79200 RepID=UPI0007EFCD26|nr:PREDICTED: F-box protein At2g43440-like isoform X1 [Daucus carota subsp. sativus]
MTLLNTHLNRNPPQYMAKKKVAVYLPEELLFNIFLRLGVKSLLRCMSVCRTWLSVISSTHFIKSQLQLAIKNPTLLIIDYRGGYAASLSSRRGYHNNFPRVVLPYDLKNCEVVSCSYNGIICLCDDKDVFYLWNPSIRKYKTLPPAPPRELAARDNTGFGYDSISDDYKIVRIVYERSEDDMPTVHLYSTNANSRRQFRDPIVKSVPGGKTNTDIVVNGVLYFNDGDGLISFDLHKEVFGRVTLPGFWETKRSNVLDFEGSVAIVFEPDGDEQGIYLWTLDDVSGRMQWTRNFRIHAYSESRLWLYCYLGAGDFYGKMASYDYFLHNILYDYKREETEICGVRENVCATLKYTQTLVSPNGFERVY